MANFFVVDTSKLVRGAARIMYAASGQTAPASISDVIDTTTYAAQSGWSDLGATKNGIAISINNTESAFTVDQVSGDIGTAPDVWSCTVSTELAEISLEKMQIAWEGATVTTDSNVTPSEKETGFAGATSYTERRLAVLFQKASLDIVGYFFWRAVRAPQQGTITYQKGGDAQTIAVQFNILADTTQVDPLKAFFIVREQQ